MARRQRRRERLLDARFAEWDATIPEVDQPGRVRLDQLDRMAEPREPDGADKTDIACADDGDRATRRRVLI